MLREYCCTFQRSGKPLSDQQEAISSCPITIKWEINFLTSVHCVVYYLDHGEENHKDSLFSNDEEHNDSGDDDDDDDNDDDDSEVIRDQKYSNHHMCSII